jgi:hypothetical protein
MVFRHPIRNLQKMHYIFVAQTNLLTWYGEIISVYFEIHTNHTYSVGAEYRIFKFPEIHIAYISISR